MGKLYSVDQHKDNRKIRPEMVVLGVLLLLALVGWLYVRYDLNKNQTVIDDSRNQPILGAVISNEDPYKTIEKENYRVDIPENWIQVNSPVIIVGGRTYNPDRYQGTSGDNIGRILDVYYGPSPASLPVSKVLSVQTIDGQIEPKEISPQCRSFTDTGAENIPAGNPYPSKWNDIEFTCRTSSVTNTVYALENSSSEGLVFDIDGRKERFGIVYTDHGSDLNNNIFFEILKRFEAK